MTTHNLEKLLKNNYGFSLKKLFEFYTLATGSASAMPDNVKVSEIQNMATLTEEWMQFLYNKSIKAMKRWISEAPNYDLLPRVSKYSSEAKKSKIQTNRPERTDKQQA